MKIVIDLYTDILASAGLIVDNDNLVCKTLKDQDIPVELDGKFLILPTQEVLRDPDWENTIAFHPLAENVVRGESEVFKLLQKLLATRVTNVLSDLAMQLLAIAANTSVHAKLSPKQSIFLSHVVGTDKKTLDTFTKVLKTTSVDGKNRLINLYLKRGGMFKKTKYNRLCVVDLPCTKEIEKDDRKMFGVPLRIVDTETLPNIFSYLLPGEYTQGSQSKTAPYFHALLLSFIALAKDLNKKITIFKNVLDNADDLFIDVSWEDAIDDFAKLRDLIPSLEGNQGKTVQEQTQSTGAVIQSAPIPTAPHPAQQNWNNNQPVPQQQGWNNQQPVQQPMQQPIQQPVQSGPVVNNEGKISFSSISGTPHTPIQQFNRPVNHGSAGRNQAAQQNWNQPNRRPQGGF